MNFKKILERIPVTINDCYGDPLFSSQFPNTLFKLKELNNREGPVTIITKGLVRDGMIEEMKPYTQGNFVLVYSFTGLNEAGFTFKQRSETVKKLCEMTDNLFLLIRPIIPDKNDSMKIIQPIMDLGSDLDLIMGYGGYKIIGSDKIQFINSKLEEQIKSYAHKKGIILKIKSSCGVSEYLNTPCATHRDEPIPNIQGINLLKLLGYEFEQRDEKLYLPKGSIGDVNFFRFITNSQPKFGDINKTTNILSFSNRNKIYEATSSYFLWSQNISSCYGCDYCLIRDLDHLRELDKTINIGCNPIDLMDLIKND
jgi:hypothetical protein